MCPHPSLYSLSLICSAESGLVKKQPQCTLYLPGSFGKLVGAGLVLTVPGALACLAGGVPFGEARCM